MTLWNTKGEQKAFSKEKNHQDCVNKIRFSPSAKNEYYASVGWDGRLKIWTKFFKCNASFKASEDPLYALSISTNGVYIATGGKDCKVKIWKLQAFDKPQVVYDADSVVNDCAFNPKYQWVVAACDNGLRTWDISNEPAKALISLDVPKGEKFKFTSVAWDREGTHIFAGCNDGVIRVYKVDMNSSK